MTNVLLVNPRLPRSFWSFPDIMRVTGKKALMPSLGLLTVAGLLPDDWTARMADENVHPVSDEDLAWADVVMVSAMLVQRDGLFACARRAKALGKIVAAGGPYVTSAPQEVLDAGCDFVIVGEGERTIPLLVQAIAEGRTGGIITVDDRTDMAGVPLPRYDLINPRDYDAMPLQTSRGCPFACEFCDVINLFGRTPRYKSCAQVTAELSAILDTGHLGSVFFTDDNFIGNPGRARELLRAIADWNRAHGEPFWFITQASVNLGGSPELIDLMTAANFGYVFVGIESPDTDVLAATHKYQNIKHPLLESIRAIGAGGLTVVGSFILGFDNEAAGAGKRVTAFAEAAHIPLVMVNTLQAVPETELWKRLRDEGRLVDGDIGDMATGTMNFTPTRPLREIVTEQLETWDHLYDMSHHMERVMANILSMRPVRSNPATGKPPRSREKRPSATALADTASELRLLARLVWRMGVVSRHRVQFWRQLVTVAQKNPSRWRRYLTLLVMGDDILSFTAVIRDRAAPSLR